MSGIKKCSGKLIPQYKDIFEMRSNPFYGLLKPVLGNFSHIDTTNPLMRIHHKVEIEPICFDCKRKDCKRSNEEL